MPLDRDLTREINRATADVLEDWIGREKWGSLVHTSTYGIRRYTNGSTLQAHVDVVATHAVSAILNVGQDVDSDWPLQIMGHDGHRALRDHGARRHGALRVGESDSCENDPPERDELRQRLRPLPALQGAGRIDVPNVVRTEASSRTTSSLVNYDPAPVACKLNVLTASPQKMTSV